MANRIWISGQEAADLLGVARERVMRMRGIETRARGRGFQVRRSTLSLHKLTLVAAKRGKRN